MVRVRFLLVGPFLSENLCCSSFLGHSYSSLTGRIIKSDMYFSQKVNTIRDKTDFLAFHSYFWTTLLVHTFNSVSSSMWKRLHHSFRPHRFGRFYRLQYFYHAFHFYRTFCCYRSFDFCFEYVSFIAGFRNAGTSMRLFYLWHSWISTSAATVWHSLGTTFGAQGMHILRILRTTNRNSFHAHIVKNIQHCSEVGFSFFHWKH